MGESERTKGSREVFFLCLDTEGTERERPFSFSLPSSLFVQHAVFDLVPSLLHLFVHMSACDSRAQQTNQSADVLVSKSKIWDVSLSLRLIFCVNLALWMECFLHPSRVRLDESPEKAFVSEKGGETVSDEQQRPGELNQTCSLAPGFLYCWCELNVRVA